MYSLLPLLYFFLLATLPLLSSCRHEGVRPALPGLRGLLGASSPSRRPCGALLQLRRALSYFVLRFRCIRHFVIIVINNIRIRFIMSFYVICAMIYCSFCCIYVWLDPGTYMIARFMFFYKPGVTQGPSREGARFWQGEAVAVPPKLIRLKCANHHFKDNPG